MKKSNKGFSLVEIIVVLVIMAILVAVSIPALTGFIEDARAKSKLGEARAIYTAAQAAVTEQYAMNPNYVSIASQFVDQYGNPSGRVTAFALYTVQNSNGGTLNAVDKAIAQKVLIYLNSDVKSTADYKFNNSNNSLGVDVDSYQASYNQPAIIIAYNPDGVVTFIEYGVDGYIYHIEKGTATIQKGGSLTNYPN